MKVAPVSADLLIKLALTAAVIGVVVYGVRKAAAALPSPGKIWNTATDAAYSVAPWNQDNVIYGTVNRVAAGGDPNWTLGGWIYDATHRDPVQQQGGGATGSW